MGKHKNVYDLQNLTTEAGPRRKGNLSVNSDFQYWRFLRTPTMSVIRKEQPGPSISHGDACVTCVGREHINYALYIMNIYRC